VATSLLTTYEIPLRILSTTILIYVYYTTTKSLSVNCKIS
jgi:ABC-type multidrug transport system permease subunit